MALIVCTECGKEFSDKAAACPNCGCPTEEVKAVLSKGVANTDRDKDQVLRDYLESLRMLEIDVYTMDETIDKLRHRYQIIK